MKSIVTLGWALGLSLVLTLGISTESRASSNTLTPTSAVDLPAGGIFGVADNLINSSGLSGTMGVGDDALKTHEATSGGFEMWVTNGDRPVDGETLTFGFSGNVPVIFGTYIWNYNQVDNAGRGVHTFTIDIDHGSGFSAVVDPSTLLPEIFSLTPGTGAEPVSAQFLAFTATNVQQVRFDIVSNWDGVSSGDDLVGLSEVRFEAPEPASLGLLAAGGALLLGKRGAALVAEDRHAGSNRQIRPFIR